MGCYLENDNEIVFSVEDINNPFVLYYIGNMFYSFHGIKGTYIDKIFLGHCLKFWYLI